ncbi:MAG TPA: OmpA family protein, partial [Polyangiaceae bacterium]|nr:OmpA family protein [Polyangiaceae bacterium]
TPDVEGRVKFTLPPSTSFDTSARFPVVIASKGDSKNPLLREGTVLARLNLEPFANLVRERQASQLAVGDQAEFENVVHGDPAARNGFTTECSPSGKDVCFDAIDNDCDGLYDVGCGYQSGALQWTLAWRTGDDLDLHVVGPDGHHVWYQRKQGGAAGLQLDVDCLGQFGNNCLAQNAENIFTPRDRKPMEGTYRGWVEVFRAVEGEDAGRVVGAMLGGRIAGKTFRMPMNLQAQRGVRVYFAFAIGKDRDKDSVIDRQDACPDQPGVFSYLAQENGCPDQDMDGVADKVDACPAEPGVRDNDRKKNGCARSYGHARLTARGVEIDGTIRFATGSATLLPEAYPLLRDVARVMRELPQALDEISIEGHTDDVGEEAKNYELSRERVKSVQKHMVNKERIALRRLTYAWFGEARPLPGNTNATDAERAANRRVEFRVVKPEPQIVLSW